MPWVIHFSGKNAAIVCIHRGSAAKTKNTPEMNCSTIAIGEITAGAVRPFLTHEVIAMPSSVQAVMPSTLTQSEGQPAAALGRQVAARRRARRQRAAAPAAPSRRRRPGRSCPRSTPSGGIGVPASRLSAPLSRSIGMEIAEVLEAAGEQARGDHAGDEDLRERHAAVDVLPAEHRAEDHQQQDREGEGEDDRLALAHERLQLDRGADPADRQQRRRPVVGGAGRPRGSGQLDAHSGLPIIRR